MLDDQFSGENVISNKFISLLLKSSVTSIQSQCWRTLNKHELLKRKKKSQGRQWDGELLIYEVESNKVGIICGSHHGVIS